MGQNQMPACVPRVGGTPGYTPGSSCTLVYVGMGVGCWGGVPSRPQAWPPHASLTDSSSAGRNSQRLR